MLKALTKMALVASMGMLLLACSSEDPEPELVFNDFQPETNSITYTSANIIFYGSFSFDNRTFLYRKKNTGGTFQELPFEGSRVELTNLERATTYEYKVQISNNSSTKESDTYYLTTKAVTIDYNKLLLDKEPGYTSPTLLFAHTNQEITIHAEGLSEFDNVALYLVNEERTDSLAMATTKVADSLRFTIPEDFLGQDPRETDKKTFVGLQIGDTYQYLMNYHAYVNFITGKLVSGDEGLLRLKIINSKPYIRSVDVRLADSSQCLNYTQLTFLGDFLGYWEEYSWTPSSAQITIYDADGAVYYSQLHEYGDDTDECGDLWVTINSSKTLVEGVHNYHQRNYATTKIYLMPDGDYSAELRFEFNDGQLPRTTERFYFTKE
ncbi:hypothetical protein EHW67_02465 [Arenibacter aquaticus]|uniref:Fibronectin type-III domain-containing protein n=1 Tax=Arenibacter aquaticus TaxID=2489054 RepID=A0A3S0B1D2_9FLAO|nr:hypothetical protein [Arenibacter aquaticus]RTE55449.1 hypothetical protein EHW67_02465 [Arenibacter aquaticus]